jgi:hypothetical protein
MLPAHPKKSSILTCAYNADVLSFLGRTSDERILEHAHTLVADGRRSPGEVDYMRIATDS